MEIQNATIKSTFLGLGRGIMTFFLHLEWERSGQGFGGYALDRTDSATGSKVAINYSMPLIREVLSVVGADSWEAVAGKLVRVEFDSNRVIRIGNIMENRWLSLEEFTAPYIAQDKQ